MGLGLLAPKISLLNFYLLHVDVGPAHSASPQPCPSYPSGWMSFFFFFNSMVEVGLPFNSISDL